MYKTFRILCNIQGIYVKVSTYTGHIRILCNLQGIYALHCLENSYTQGVPWTTHCLLLTYLQGVWLLNYDFREDA